MLEGALEMLRRGSGDSGCSGEGESSHRQLESRESLEVYIELRARGLKRMWTSIVLPE